MPEAIHDGHVHIHATDRAVDIDLDALTGQRARTLDQVPIGQLMRYARHQSQPGHEQVGCTECHEFIAMLIRCYIAEDEHVAVAEGGMVSPPPVGDILDAVDDDGQLRCACGCRQVITDASPSAYYATQDCQLRWMRRQATNPGEVYARPDAHVAISADIMEERRRYERENPQARRSDNPFLEVPPREPEVPADAPAVAWLRQLSDPVTQRAELTFGSGGDRVRVDIPPPELHRFSMFDYMRRCRVCGDTARPWTVSGPTYVHQLVSLPPAPGERHVYQQCGWCRTKLPGRVYLGTLHVHEDPYLKFGFMLEDGLSQTTYQLDTRHRMDVLLPMTPAEMAPDMRRIWTRLEERLDRFADDWRAVNNPSPTFTGLPYQIDVPPPPGRRGRRL